MCVRLVCLQNVVNSNSLSAAPISALTLRWSVKLFSLSMLPSARATILNLHLDAAPALPGVNSVKRSTNQTSGSIGPACQLRQRSESQRLGSRLFPREDKCCGSHKQFQHPTRKLGLSASAARGKPNDCRHGAPLALTSFVGLRIRRGTPLHPPPCRR